MAEKRPPMPARMGGASGYKMQAFAMAPQISSPFFSESNPSPHALTLFSSQGPARKKQRDRGFQCPEMSELNPRTSLSPHKEISPILFTHPDQHPSVAVSNLISFGGSDDSELDDSLSLAASDAKEIFSTSCLTLWRSWVWNSLPQRNRPVATWIKVSCPLQRQNDSQFFPQTSGRSTHKRFR